MRISRLVLGALAVVLLAGTPPAVAQDPAAPSAQQQADPAVTLAQGQLVRVDTSAKTIAIKTEADVQMVFSYDDSTKVTGSDQDIAGLGTMSGTDVKVEYTKEGQKNIATRIEVLKKPSA